MTRRSKSVRFGEPNVTEQLQKKTTPVRGILKRTAPTETAPQGLISRLFAGGVDVPSRGVSEVFELIKDAIINNNYRTNQHVETENCPPTLLEAYTILNICLKSREGANEVAGEARRIVQAVKRDFLQVENTKDVLEVRVIVQIFRVVDGLLSNQSTASVIEAEYVRFFLGHATDILASSDSSKALTGVCIHLFTNLYFPKALSSDLASRLLLSMGGRPTFPSAGLAAEYLTAYRMMLLHHRQMMVDNANCWVETLVHSLCDSNAFVRQQALLTLSECNRKLSCENSISKAILDAFQTEDSDGDLFGTIMCQKLSIYLGSQGDARTIMSIWSNVLIALSANSEEKLRNWQFLGKWLDVCKQGLHSVYLSTKEASLVAWRTAIYIFAFDSRPEHFERNLQPLTYPFKLIRGTTPTVILKRHMSLLNALLFIGFRTHLPSPELYEVIWSKVVAPAVQCLFASGSEEARSEATATLNFLLRNGQHVSPGPSPLRSRAIVNDIELSECGGFPSWWVKQNSHLVCDLIVQMQQATSTNEVLGLWQIVASICKQSLASEVHESNESVAQIASMLTLLLRVPKTEVVAFISSMTDTVGVASLLTKRFAISEDGQTVTPTKAHPVSAIAILLEILFTKSDQAYMESTFLRILNQSGTVRRALSLIGMAVVISNAPEIWKTCAFQACHTFIPQTGTLEGDDIDNVLLVLSSVPNGEMDADGWSLWAELFGLALKFHDKEEPFITLLSRMNPQQVDLKTLVALKNGPLLNRSGINSTLVRIFVSQIDALPSLKQDLLTLSQTFRGVLCRQLVSSTFNSSMVDFAMVLNLVEDLADGLDLVDYADVFVMGLRSGIEEHKLLAAEKWNKLYADIGPDAKFSNTVIATVRHMHACQGIDIVIPPSIPLLSSSSGYQSPMRKHMMFPSSSPPQSPTEDLLRVKRRRVTTNELEYCLASPPMSSDNVVPGAHAMDLFRRLHDTSDPIEIEQIKEEQTLMAKPKPIPLLSEMEDLCSSPPRIAGEDSRERSKELSTLKSALMRSDLRRNLKKGVSKSECQLLEKLLMDSLVSVRIHMANSTE